MKTLAVIIGLLAAWVAIPMLLFAQKLVQDSGWINIGSATETATNKRSVGSLYKGVGVQTFAGKLPRSPTCTGEDMSAYELDAAPAADRSKPYNRRDFTGVWEKLPHGGPNTLTTRIPPMSPLGYQILEERITASGPRAYISATKRQNDPQLMCDPIGWPYLIYRSARPVEMIHIPGRMLQHWAWHDSWRAIWTDGRLLPKIPDPTFYGYSVGKWVGDVFVADTIAVDNRAWLDDLGDPHTDKAEMQERWRRTDHNTLQFNMTLKDPAIYFEYPGIVNRLCSSSTPNLEVDYNPCVPSEELEYRDNSPTEAHEFGKQ